MTIRIYNTLGGKKEAFEPIEAGKVRMYVCGPTVYDSCHIGHARSVIVFDVIARYLKARGYDVTYVRNFTDVDDKIIQRANQLGIPPLELAEKYIREFYEDMDALNVERATIEPRATAHIAEMIALIEGLIQKGIAYPMNGDVYYKVDAFRGYGKLSGRNLEDMEAGARVDVDEKKINPFDFALWKAAKPGEPSWESPWGMGRPGWHIECSAMSRAYLGETFDIHGGGKDLIFPHHENEIAQSEAAFDKPFARYWIHNGFVNINQEKMSKSLGNILMIRDILKTVHPEVLRLFVLSNHYRSPIDYSDQALEEASTGIEKMYALLQRLESVIGLPDTDHAPSHHWEAFTAVMDDDFNTARGIAVLYDAIRHMNRELDAAGSPLPKSVEETLRIERCDLLRIGNALGILKESPNAFFEQQKNRALAEQRVDPEWIDSMIQKRAEARKMKNWKLADQIRVELEQKNIVLEDRPEGTIWKAV